jgi:hypothetical protein
VATKRPSARKKTPARRARRAAAPQMIASHAAAKHLTLDEHLEAILGRAEPAAAAGSEAGACLLSDPHTGENSCLLVDRDTCKSLHGVFIGGPMRQLTRPSARGYGAELYDPSKLQPPQPKARTPTLPTKRTDTWAAPQLRTGSDSNDWAGRS